MRCLIVGAGAVGQYFAARFALAGHEPVLLARANVCDAINQRGITLRSGDGEWPIAARAAAQPDDDVLREPFELAIVAVKAYSTVEAADTIASVTACQQSTILTVQNGLGNEELLAARFGADRVVAGALTVPVDRIDETTVVAPVRGGLMLAPVGDAANNWVLAAFANSGISVRAAADWRSLKWSKLLVNLAANAVCAALDMTPQEVYANPAAFSIEMATFREALQVMRAEGVRPMALIGLPVPVLAWEIDALPVGLLRFLFARLVATGRAGKLPSLMLDLRAVKTRTEVAWLNGAVATRATSAGFTAPANAAVTRIVEGIAAGTIERSAYRHQSEKLRADIDARRSNA